MVAPFISRIMRSFAQKILLCTIDFPEFRSEEINQRRFNQVESHEAR
jgi:hypothetical protein